MNRTIRYQGAIIQDDCVLLIRFRDPLSDRTFWLIPGGGLEPDETEEECVRREMREETNLQVRVERLLLEGEDPAGVYPRLKTYLCRAESGTPSPGYEPGPLIPEGYGIIETGWFPIGQTQAHVRTSESSSSKCTTKSARTRHLATCRLSSANRRTSKKP